MNKIFILILFLQCVRINPSDAQTLLAGGSFELGIEDSPVFKTKKKKDRIYGFDLHYLGGSFHYSQRIKSDHFIGFEAGFLPDKFEWIILAGKHFTQENTIWSDDRSQVDENEPCQIVFFHAFFRWKPTVHWFEMDSGFRVALYVRDIPGEDSIGAPVFSGLFVKPLVGWNRFKIGFRSTFGVMFERLTDTKEWVSTLSPVIRVNLN